MRTLHSTLEDIHKSMVDVTKTIDLKKQMSQLTKQLQKLHTSYFPRGTRYIIKIDTQPFRSLSEAKIKKNFSLALSLHKYLPIWMQREKPTLADGRKSTGALSCGITTRRSGSSKMDGFKIKFNWISSVISSSPKLPKNPKWIAHMKNIIPKPVCLNLKEA